MKPKTVSLLLFLLAVAVLISIVVYNKTHGPSGDCQGYADTFHSALADIANTPPGQPISPTDFAIELRMAQESANAGCPPIPSMGH